MVNTFVFAPTPEGCAALLDYKRLGKQRVEAMQLINVLEGNSNEKSWKMHPASKMWIGHIAGLKHYTNCMIREWIRRGYKNNMKIYEDADSNDLPIWFKSVQFHTSHKCALLRKDNSYYKNIFILTPEEQKIFDARVGYIWPHKLDQKQMKLLVMNQLPLQYYDPLGSGIPPQYRYSKEVINKWNSDRLKNPITNRSIKQGGPMYKDFEKAYVYFSSSQGD